MRAINPFPCKSYNLQEHQLMHTDHMLDVELCAFMNLLEFITLQILFGLSAERGIISKNLRSMWSSRALTNIIRTASNHAAAKPTHYKYTYFDIKGLGESVRLQFVLAGVEFEDCRLPREKWAEYKATTGWGQLPILNINGKETEIIQSSAIGRYLAGEFNQLADTKIQQVRCDELVAVFQDMFIEWRLWIRQAAPWVPNKDPKRVFEVQSHILQNVFPHYFAKTNEFIKLHGSNGYVVGNKITWADLVVGNLLDVWTSKHGSGIIEKFPKLVEQKQVVFSEPKIKEWVAKRPLTFA